MIKGRTSRNHSPQKLLVPRKEAIRRIRDQIETGRNLKDQKMFSMMDLESALESRTKWLEDNVATLTRLLNNPFLEEEYNVGRSFELDSAITFTLKEKYFRDDINEQLGKLESFLESVKLMPETSAEEFIEEELVEGPIRQEQPRLQSNESLKGESKFREEIPKEEPIIIRKPPREEPLAEVAQRRTPLREERPSRDISRQSQFSEGNILLIHGRDEATKESILGFIEKLGLRALILHEQPNEGRSIIEKSGELSNIDFAIILFTPDEIAASRNKPKERRARVSQNVIFEFGYFLGKLGPQRVCALYKEGVEIPSEYSGVVCIPMDSKGGWRLFVAKEIKQAGIEIDLNQAI
jgi:predicted nucleotide-binding protein